MKSFLPLFILLCLIAGCSSQILTTESSSTLEQQTPLKSVEDFVKKSAYIVEAEYEDKSLFSGDSQFEYKFSVKNQYKGEITDDYFYTLGYENEFVPETSYILFLESYESSLYPHILYINQVQGYNLTLGESLDQAPIFRGLSPEEIKELIENSSPLSFHGTEPKIPDYAESPKALIENSDVIVMLEIVSEEPHNKYVSYARAKRLQSYKGKLDKGPYLLPSSIEAGQKVIAFFNKNGDQFNLSTRKDSVYFENAAGWDEILSLLNN
ncbi:hypothetical protein SAMN05877753_110154 [Bacillus oleivorans]|uniref:Lipoprotein n=1 Tax=Bacillus oleivorans TaxID=1448271 RepID=A0A285D6X7_9BACI|nr:hypothetical protein SAMN05877753_110154 [Bacillus oleivorans]